ncbi:MAG: phosphoribosyltransferase family protein [Roseiflexus sp.]|nr:phosphoribosyltransferase family protein [Roseiflexus sp.]MCS7289203.1 phosphoribosyltransferase family protein [Roseiflexus sp.]MDW8144753.1 phosphoribosyltransferase family protein [Roseiflexaceae bacterium]MDW8232204.1 phosphoribosyltransferase family protein [Roseiflexaceae bacterium]
MKASPIEPIYGAPLIGCDDRYEDRAAAGRRLASFLGRFRGTHAVVLAIPPGGVAVAGELARSLRLPVDVIVAREFRVRAYPVIAAGGISESGGLCLNGAILRLPGVTPTVLWEAVRAEQAILPELIALYRHCRPLPFNIRRPVILVDDGLSSGLAQLAAIQALRRYHPVACLLVTPRADERTLRMTRPWADDVIVLNLLSADGPTNTADGWRLPLSDEDAAILLERYRLHVAP